MLRLFITIQMMCFGLAFLNPLSTLAQAKNKVFTVAFYNLENLFDTINDPTIDDEDFLPEGKLQWNHHRYKQKLANMSRVIDSLGDPDGPEILGLCEVENSAVLHDLIKTSRLFNKNYAFVHQNSPDGRGIDVALLYKSSFFTPISHSILPVRLPQDPTFKTRDILLVKGKTIVGDQIYLFINHWPSRRGGKETSELKRLQAANVARKAIDSLLQLDNKAKIILMGDFNDEPTDMSISQILKANHTPPPAGSNELYNLMWPLKASGKGSHMHSREWNMLDQIIVTNSLLIAKKGLKVLPQTAGIYSPNWLTDPNPKFSGSPFRTYAGEKYLGGYSDHFAVYVHLVKVKKQ